MKIVKECTICAGLIQKKEGTLRITVKREGIMEWLSAPNARLIFQAALGRNLKDDRMGPGVGMPLKS